MEETKEQGAVADEKQLLFIQRTRGKNNPRKDLATNWDQLGAGAAAQFADRLGGGEVLR